MKKKDTKMPFIVTLKSPKICTNTLHEKKSNLVFEIKHTKDNKI